ncbi:MAG: hypothetical protein GPJ17_11275 [Microcystis aeruginosa K13-07]|nr:hypothetical protein [Microcystis aeruginosa K13-07]
MAIYRANELKAQDICQVRTLAILILVYKQCDRNRCRVRSLMWLLLLHQSIFGERTMHIY